jgi:hypothetical protein
MRNLFKTIDHIERTLARGLEQRPAAPPSKPKPSPRSWHAPTTNTVYPSGQVLKPKKDKPKDKPMATQLTVTTRALKVTAVLDAATVAALPTPDGQARSRLAVACDGKIYTADIATKSLRKVKAAIAANGVDGVAVIVQGRLKNNEIAECGLVAQVKAKGGL